VGRVRSELNELLVGNVSDLTRAGAKQAYGEIVGCSLVIISLGFVCRTDAIKDVGQFWRQKLEIQKSKRKGLEPGFRYEATIQR
jgi:hypothetical protein